MSKRLGPRTFGRKQKQVFLGRDIHEDRNYSEAIATQIDEEIKKIVEERYEIAKTAVEENMDILKEIVAVLIDKEVIEKEELDKIFSDKISREEKDGYLEKDRLMI